MFRSLLTAIEVAEFARIRTPRSEFLRIQLRGFVASGPKSRLQWTLGGERNYNPPAEAEPMARRANNRSRTGRLRSDNAKSALPKSNGRPCSSDFFGKTVKTGR